MIISSTQRRFVRDKNGTVMFWKDNGVNKETLVLDTIYRRYMYWYTDNVDIPELECCCDGYGYITDTINHKSDPKLSIQSVLQYTATDEYLDSRLFHKDINTSKHNTDCICDNTNSNQVAAVYCKSINAVLPNLQTLIRIYCDGMMFDNLDPTVTDYPDRGLSVTNSGWFSNDIPFAWSSSQFDYYYAWSVLSTGLVGTVGKSDLIGGVIPVIELK